MNNFLFNATKTLQSNTFLGLIVGENIITLQRVNSTNDYLKHSLSNSTPYREGTVIMAEDQYAGKGQMGSIWASQAGRNLTFSVLFNPDFLSPKDQFQLNIAISLAITQLLEPMLGKKLRIKWPNDIYVDDKKLGGILIENIIRGTTWKHAIVGIGLNINQTDFDETHHKACSLKQILGKTFAIKPLLNQLCKALSNQYYLLQQGNIAQQKAQYKNSLYRFGEASSFKIGDQLMYGKIIDITTTGRLLIDFGDQVSDFGIKEITFC